MHNNCDKEDKIIFYMHAGSGNHGCEAIVNSLTHMLAGSSVLGEGKKPLVITNSEEEDRRYSLGELCELVEEQHFSEHRLMHILYYIWRKLKKDPESFMRYRYRAVFGKKKYPLAISIGGDNYCYDMMVKDLVLANRAFDERGTATVLLGCSIEPELLQNPATADIFREDMNRYHAIIARESITYGALKNIVEQEKLFLIPDPAFTLGKKELPLPDGFKERNTIGINLSPMIQDKENQAGITMANYKALLKYIIDTTDLQIALIPHVIWERNDDRKPLKELYESFKESGRVVMIEDASCEELKGYIARCRLFIGARTHATIAAYSSLVPTLVVGYSVKAKGIAVDLFGTYENYVIPVQQLENKEDLIRAFEWLKENEDSLRTKLEEVMPSYMERALQTGKEVETIWEELNTRQKI